MIQVYCLIEKSDFTKSLYQRLLLYGSLKLNPIIESWTIIIKPTSHHKSSTFLMRFISTKLCNISKIVFELKTLQNNNH